MKLEYTLDVTPVRTFTHWKTLKKPTYTWEETPDRQQPELGIELEVLKLRGVNDTRCTAVLFTFKI